MEQGHGEGSKLKRVKEKKTLESVTGESRGGNEVMEVQKLHFTASPFPTGPQASPAEASVAFLS